MASRHGRAGAAAANGSKAMQSSPAAAAAPKLTTQDLAVAVSRLSPGETEALATALGSLLSPEQCDKITSQLLLDPRTASSPTAAAPSPSPTKSQQPTAANTRKNAPSPAPRSTAPSIMAASAAKNKVPPPPPRERSVIYMYRLPLPNVRVIADSQRSAYEFCIVQIGVSHATLEGLAGGSEQISAMSNCIQSTWDSERLE